MRLHNRKLRLYDTSEQKQFYTTHKNLFYTMSSYYVMKEMPDLQGTGERIVYPQFAHIEQTTTHQLGTFTPALALRPGKEREEPDGEGTRRNARSIEVGGVNFRVDKTLLYRTNALCEPVRAPWKPRRSSQQYTSEERLRLALDYLEKHPYLTVTEYRKLTGLLRTAATEELKAWAADTQTGIRAVGRGTHRVYVKEMKNEE